MCRDNASSNASDMIGALTMKFNRTRQAAVVRSLSLSPLTDLTDGLLCDQTSQLIEIISGASAM